MCDHFCCWLADLFLHFAAFEVPQDLLTLVQDDSRIIKWLIGSMHITHMTEGAPIVKISAMNPVQGVFKGPDFLLDMFNNSKRHPDLIITAHGHDILVHKCIVACGSDVLNRQWDALWLQDEHPGLSKWTIDSTACPFGNVGTAYSTAHMFFSFFYSGEVKWPDNVADAHSALELLVLASIYNVPFLVQAAEVVLKNHISNSNCFVLLTFADHHSAQQLCSFSLYYIANGFKLLSKSAEYQHLSEELSNQIKQVRATLK